MTDKPKRHGTIIAFVDLAWREEALIGRDHTRR